jgi:pimeloyl-ACP methyl ester carboxylesterase
MTSTLLLPGWGIPPDAYPDLGQAETADYGFWGKASAFPFAAPLPALRAWLSAGKGAILLGHSLGALLALQAAVALPRDGIRALILFCPFARFTTDEQGWPGQPPEAVRTMRQRLAENPSLLLRSFHRGAADPERIAVRSPGTPCPEALAGGLDFLLETDLCQSLAKFATPTLILHGDADRIVPPGQADRLAALLPHARIHGVAGAGHLLPLTRPDICRQAITEFLDDLP